MNFFLALLSTAGIGISPTLYNCKDPMKSGRYAPQKSHCPKVFYMPFSNETDFAITAEMFGQHGGDVSKLVGDITWIVQACKSAPRGGHFTNMLVRLKIVPCCGQTIIVEKDGTVFYSRRSRKLSKKMAEKIDSYLSHVTGWDSRVK